MQIRLELRSDTAPGSGEGQAGEVDRDITYDGYGLPVLPARRLKGALREAALEIQEALQQAGLGELLEPEIINGLFGSSYGATSRPGYLQLSDGRLEQAEELKPWLEWAALKDKNLFGPAAILANYTGFRTQTSMARLTGGPLSNTLRVSRVIRKGCVFVAEAQLEPPLGVPEMALADLRRVLAWSCAALRHLGLSRNRGLGFVKTSLHDGAYDGDKALAELEELITEAGRIS